MVPVYKVALHLTLHLMVWCVVPVIKVARLARAAYFFAHNVTLRPDTHTFQKTSVFKTAQILITMTNRLFCVCLALPHAKLVITSPLMPALHVAHHILVLEQHATLPVLLNTM
jgi:hypothetical protein